MDELMCLSWMKYLQAKYIFSKTTKKIIYMEKSKKQIKEIVLFFNNCNPLVVVYNF
jgi:hypothetical protein